MARNKKQKQEAEAAPMSSDETGSDDSSSSSDVPSTPRPLANPHKKTAPLTKKPTDNAAAAAAEESEKSDSDDSDSDLDARLASKSKPLKPPTEGSSKLKKQRPNKATPKPSTPAKRALPVDAEDSKKPAKKERAGEEDEGKKSSVLFQRLWSDEDEIALLQGMLDYKDDKGADPMLDANDFHDFIKKSLHVDVDRKQVVDKVRRMRKRYEYSLAGKKKTFTPHEERAGQLSKLIWGTTVVDKPTPTTPIKARGASNSGSVDTSNGFENHVNDASDTDNKAWKFIGKASISMGMDENMVKLGLELCSEDSKAEMEAKWKQIHLEEAALFIRKLDLVRQESNLITQALKSKSG